MLRSFSIGIAALALILWLILFAGGIAAYSGNKFVYAIFSFVLLAMLANGVYRQTSYGYLFLVIFIWLGFWFKFTVHIVFDYPFLEPVGNFYGSDQSWYRASWIAPSSYSKGEELAWDSVLWVGIVGSTAVLAAHSAYGWLWNNFSQKIRPESIPVPRWYPAARVWLWSGLLFIIVALAVMNGVLGVQQAGLIPKTILPWPLNALISWIVSIGSAMGVATLVHWDAGLKKSAALSIYAILLEALVSSVSLLSRAVYIFHVLPQLLALFKNRKHVSGITRMRALGIMFAAVCLFVASIAAVTVLRSQFYWQISRNSPAVDSPEGQSLSKEKNAIPSAHAFPLQMSVNSPERQTASKTKNAAPPTSLPPLPVSLDSPEGQTALKTKKTDTPVMSPRVQILEGAIAEVTAMIKAGKHLEMQLQKLLDEKAKLSAGEAASDTPEDSADWTSLARIPTAFAKLANEVQMVLRNIVQLAADRWIGIEGVMAVQSYGEKNMDALLTAISEKRQLGKITSYQKISNSLYQEMDKTKNQFASLPGAIGFFLIGGSSWLVAIGLFALTSLLLLGERVIYAVTGNPLLCALVGLTMANTVAQFGVAPRQDLPYFFMIFLGVLTIWFMQSELLFRILSRVGLSNAITR